ncbi:MAG TPA: glycosyltransferase family 1 protein [Phycisphaerales bacterium]|nr:glycosyltransferase family 1 protein [Phycisphaerales bacterium]
MQNTLGACRPWNKKTNRYSKRNGNCARTFNSTTIGTTMTVAMVISKDRLEQEHALFNRLVIGLLDAGNQIIRVVPETETDELPYYEQSVSLAKRITTPMPISRLLRSERKEKLIEQFEKNEVKMIVGFGKDAMQVAIDVGKAIDVPIMCEVVSMRDTKAIKKSSPIWRWLAATPSIEKEIERRVGTERVALVPLGVTGYSNEENRDVSKKNCIVVLDASGNAKQTRAVLESLRSNSNVHIFLELLGKHEHRIWKIIRQLEMQHCVTCLLDTSELRTLIMHCDLLVIPNNTMPIRSILLEAMLQRVPVVCTELPGFDMLIDKETALIVRNDWKSAIATLLDPGSEASAIGDNGAELIKEKYASATQIAAFEAAFTLI